MLSVFGWFVLVLQCEAFIVVVLSDEPGQNQGLGLVDRKLAKAPHPLSNFIAGRPKAGLLLLFFIFDGLRCNVWLCFVILVRYKTRK